MINAPSANYRSAGNFPQHRTVCEFRRRHLEDFKKLFVEVVRLARELGLASFGKLSIDGTKVRANASKHKAMSYGRMQEEEQRLSGEIQALLEAAGAADASEDASFGVDVRGDELPAELRRQEERLLAAIRDGVGVLEVGHLFFPIVAVPSSQVRTRNEGGLPVCVVPRPRTVRSWSRLVLQSAI